MSEDLSLTQIRGFVSIVSGTKDRSFGGGSGDSGSDSAATVEKEVESAITGRGPRGASESMGETLPGERIRRGSMMPSPSLLLGEGELWKEPAWGGLCRGFEGRTSPLGEDRDRRRCSGLRGEEEKEQHHVRRRMGPRRPAETDPRTPRSAIVANDAAALG